jgi:hypothetical protein
MVAFSDLSKDPHKNNIILEIRTRKPHLCVDSDDNYAQLVLGGYLADCRLVVFALLIEVTFCRCCASAKVFLNDGVVDQWPCCEVIVLDSFYPRGFGWAKTCCM